MFSQWRISGVLLAAAALAATLATRRAGAKCVPQTSANPIWKDHFTGVTGVINGTIAVLPIPYTLARSIVPQQYGILTGYKALLEPAGWPEDTYPLVLETRIDHDVRTFGIPAAGFSSARLFFPFVDRNGDGQSGFRYAPTIVLSSSIPAQIFSTLYGEKVIVATFQPECDAYAGTDGTTTFEATSTTPGAAAVSVQLTNLPNAGPWPLAFYHTIVNQPFFANNLVCNWFEVPFDSPLTTGDNTPIGVKGSVSVNAWPLTEALSLTDVYGINIAVPFVEHNYQRCSTVGGH